ncbi:hypothetical protein C0J52_12635 [Blattella germanica]|nr:hypothetical protein C0J52_12635 [Blattella germanica]
MQLNCEIHFKQQQDAWCQLKLSVIDCMEVVSMPVGPWCVPEIAETGRRNIVGGGMPNGDQFFFLMGRDSTWNLIVGVYSSGGKKGHETIQLLYVKDSHMAVVD